MSKFSGGFTLTYRDEWDHPAFRNRHEAAVFIWMVGAAQWREQVINTKFGSIKLYPGELIIAERELAAHFDLDRNAVQRLLKKMIEADLISIDRERASRRVGAIAAILNYHEFQRHSGRSEDGLSQSKPNPVSNTEHEPVVSQLRASGILEVSQSKNEICEQNDDVTTKPSKELSQSIYDDEPLLSLTKAKNKEGKKLNEKVLAGPPLPIVPKQAVLLPQGAPTPASKSLTPGQMLYTEGLEILASITRKSTDAAAQQRALCKLLGKMRREAKGDDQMLLDVLRRAKDQSAASAIGWIRGAIANGAAKLIVRNAPPDPNDGWGVEAWCRAAGLEMATDPEDLKNGKWIAHNRFFDRTAKQVASAARLPWSWRGDWSPLRDWIALKIPTDDIVRTVERMAMMDGYRPGSLKFFDNALRQGRAAA